MNYFKFITFLIILFIFLVAFNESKSDLTKNNKGHVLSDTDRLERVIVLSPGTELRRITLMAGEDHPNLPGDAMQPGAINQHKSFVTSLENQGVEVLHFDNLLDSAIRSAREKNRFKEWIRKTFPKSDVLLKNSDSLNSADLIGRGRYFYNLDDQGNFAPQLLPLKWMFFTRDMGVMTPRGFVLCNFANYDRALEAKLMKFTFHFSQELSQYPIVFDATKEGVFLQGGDLMVLDENTLLLGTGNLSDTLAAKRLAQKLEINVISVSMPPSNSRDNGYSDWTSVHLQFLHLDTYFTILDKNNILTVPYLLESQYSEDNPIFRLLKGFDQSLMNMQKDDLTRHKMRFGSIPNAIDLLKNIGWITIYESGTGKANQLNKKLVDLLRERGFNVISVGGNKEQLSEEQYILERVLFELNFQASNVVAIRPGVVFVYSENKYTIKALRAAGVEVIPFDGSFLAMWHGGPHCLTLPLERINK